MNTTSDTWEFVKQCREVGIKPIAGVEVRNGDSLLYILLAANNNGLTWIHEFISKHISVKKPFPTWEEYHILFDDTKDGFVIYPLNTKPLHALKDNERIGVLPWEPNKLFSLEWRKYQDKLVVRHPVTIKNAGFFKLHKLLRAIAHNTITPKLPKEAVADQRERFVSPANLIGAFNHYPFIITNTYKLMDACSTKTPFSKLPTPKSF